MFEQWALYYIVACKPNGGENVIIGISAHANTMGPTKDMKSTQVRAIDKKIR